MLCINLRPIHKDTRGSQTLAQTETSRPILKEADDGIRKTVVLLGKESLLGSAVEFLLSPEKDWKIERVSNEQEYDRMFQDIKKLDPSIVILYQSEQSCDAQLLVQLLDECQGLKVITVSLESNSIQVYNKQRVWIKNANDLLSLVEG
jgi:hypothetical protein